MQILNLPRVTVALLFSVTLFTAGCGSLKTASSATTPSNALLNELPGAMDDMAVLTADELSAESITPAEYADLWERLRAGFQFDVATNPRIQTHIDWYSAHPEYIQRVSERASRYLYYIVGEVEQRGMPTEFALLPIVESAFDPFAYSHGRASGMWQFIPGTGRMYGLKQNWWYDGRRDTVASTTAALDYLENLHKRFDGDWLKALAAYNSGGGNVSKAMRKNEQKNLATDFWSLDLPRETESYVPQLIALSMVVSDPERFSISLPEITNEPYFEIVDTGSQIDLAHAADLADIPIEDLYLLNAGYNRWATDPEGPHRLLVPAAKAELFTANLAAIPMDQRVTWERYKVQSGDSLLAIAKKYKTDVESLRYNNNLKGNLIRENQMLLVPVASRPSQHYTYTQQQRLIKKQASAKPTANTTRAEYTVKAGDSFWTIARQYKTTVGKLAKWNGMAPGDPLKVGQKLVVLTPVGSAAPATGHTVTGAPVVRKVAYKVRNGDSLAKIASRFSVNVRDILRWNTLAENQYIHPGDSITLFVNVAGGR